MYLVEVKWIDINFNNPLEGKILCYNRPAVLMQTKIDAKVNARVKLNGANKTDGIYNINYKVEKCNQLLH